MNKKITFLLKIVVSFVLIILLVKQVDFNKIMEVLEFEPKYSVNDGIKELIEALRQNLFVCDDEKNELYGNFQIDYD